VLLPLTLPPLSRREKPRGQTHQTRQARPAGRERGAMGRSDEAAALVGATVTAKAADEAVKAVGRGASSASSPTPLPPEDLAAAALAAPAEKPDPKRARRRARLDAACATVFRTKLLRQFAALTYKNRESSSERGLKPPTPPPTPPPPDRETQRRRPLTLAQNKTILLQHQTKQCSSRGAPAAPPPSGSSHPLSSSSWPWSCASPWKPTRARSPVPAPRPRPPPVTWRRFQTARKTCTTWTSPGGYPA
jgi:hypothetical protein